jgi:hypothetical protein
VGVRSFSVTSSASVQASTVSRQPKRKSLVATPAAAQAMALLRPLTAASVGEIPVLQSKVEYMSKLEKRIARVAGRNK